MAFRAGHRRPGDPGFDAPPAKYWRGSSLGQAAMYLGVEATLAWRLVAAADHRLGAAYRGDCSGVSRLSPGTWWKMREVL